MKQFRGAGGGKGKQAKNAPDTLFSEDVVEFVLAVSEGPIRGLTYGASSFYVGQTPLVSVSGGPPDSPNGYAPVQPVGPFTQNFEKFAVGVYPGFGDEASTPIQFVLGGETSSQSVGITLAKDTPVTRQTNSNLRGVIDELQVRVQIQQLYLADSGGTHNDVASISLEYKRVSDATWLPFYLDQTINGLIIAGDPVNLTGKTTGGYVKEFFVTVPRISNDDWQIRVTKRSLDNSSTHVCEMAWESFQTTSRGEKKYPYTAILHGVGVADSQFSSIPDFGGVYDGLIVRVPSNYNPDAHTYTTLLPWDGTFKFAWTCNPAWILYDLIVNPRYGLAAYRPYVEANRYEFYAAGRWCDEKVLCSDGVTFRPRYTYNDVISQPRQGLELLNFVAGTFNAVVWDDNNGQIHLAVDKDDPAVMLFTPENVQDGTFNYTFTDMAVRYNDITVGFTNPDLDWSEDIRRLVGVTTDETHATKYGRVPYKFIAAGCTNQEEAIAKASYRLTSALTETKVVTFQTARQGAVLSLYDVILVADPDMGWSQSGRVQSHDDDFVYFRDAIYFETTQPYVIKLQTRTGIVEREGTPEQIGLCNRLALTTPLPSRLPSQTVFTIEDLSAFGSAKPFRVTSLRETNQNGFGYEVSGIEINRAKYTQTLPAIQAPQYAFRIGAKPAPPTALLAQSGSRYNITGLNGVVVQQVFISYRKPPGVPVDRFEIHWRKKTDPNWTVHRTTDENAFLNPIDANKAYEIKVRLFTVLNESASDFVSLTNYLANGIDSTPAALTALALTPGVGEIEVSWNLNGNTDLSRVEVYRAIDNELTNADLRLVAAGDETSALDTDLTTGNVWFYWVRPVNSAGSYGPYTGPVSTTVG